jgi:hypothetical protein
MQNSAAIQSSGLSSMKLEDFGQLQVRYQALPIAARAKAILEDAAPALQTAQRIIAGLNDQPDMKKIFDKIRKNSMLIGKMRPSDARVALMDKSCDFLKDASHKLSAWQKTMERLSQGEAIASEGGKEYIKSDEPLALLVASTGSISSYMSIIQLALMEISRADKANAGAYVSMTAEMRRCSTVLSDYENASLFHTLVH